MPSRPTALVLEDDVTLARAYQRVLQSQGYAVTLAHRVDAARADIRDRAPDLILVDIDLPDGNGLDLMNELRNDTRGRFIVISGDDSQRAAVKSIRSQAVELLLKPVDLARLRALTEPSEKAERLSGTDSDDVASAPEQSLVAGPVGQSDGDLGRTVALPASRSGWFQVGDHHALSTLRTVMSYTAERSRGHALITGEPGVDKPCVAQGIHERGRRPGAFVVVDCADEQGELGMIRLFGREDPETGEVLHRGYLEQAAAGTLVLDHVERLPADIQSRLLPFLESGTFRRVDGSLAAEATVAVIGIARDAGTTDVDETSLRTDFLFRLAQTTLAVPNLRQCRDDIQAIADWLLEQATADRLQTPGFSRSSRDLIATAVWKRNVRELRSVIEQAVATTREGEAVNIDRESNDAALEGGGSEIDQWVGTTIWEFERQLLNATLLHFDGDKEKTARTLGVSLKTLYNRMNAY